MSNKISVVINTLNEEKNIKRCLESVKWADEIVIVDMNSEDRTIEIAKHYTDKIFFHRRLAYADPARNFALGKTSFNWILVLDADEVVTPLLKERLLEIKNNDEADLVYVYFQTYIFGKRMKGSGWSYKREIHPRFFKKGAMMFSPAVHANLKIDESARKLTVEKKGAYIIHYSYTDCSHYLAKYDKYTTIEAQNVLSGLKTLTLPKAIYLSGKQFLSRFILDKGFLDGLQGFILSGLMGLYPMITYMKIFLIKKYGNDTRDGILYAYDKDSMEWLKITRSNIST